MIPSNQLDQSRINVLTGSNGVSSDRELSRLHRRIVEKQLGIGNLDEDVVNTKALLDELGRRQCGQKNLNHVVSAIGHLPFEIFGRIFVLAHEHSDDDVMDRFPKICSSPLLFGHVCSYWRQISHSTPAFWSSLTLHLSLKMMKAPERTQEMMKQWLARAYPLPFNISLSSHPDDNNSIDFEQILLPHAGRMRKLNLSLHFPHWKRLLTHPMPLLEVLEIHRFSNEPDKWDAPAISFEESPRLHTIVLHSPEFLQSGILTPPWPQLTSLELNHNHPVHDVLKILSLATNLHKCSIQGWGASRLDTTLNSAPVIHHNLCELTVVPILSYSESESPVTSYFFKHLTLPALHHATLGMCESTELTSFADLQCRSKSSLEALQLTIKGSSRALIDASVDKLNRLLINTPSLVQLRLEVFINDDARRCLEMLHCVPTEQSLQLLPCVEEIHLDLSTHNVDGQWVIDLIKKRWWPGHDTTRSGVASLKHLSVSTRNVGVPVTLRPEDVEQLREFEREGLVLEITGFNRNLELNDVLDEEDEQL